MRYPHLRAFVHDCDFIGWAFGVAALNIPVQQQQQMLEIVGALPSLHRLALPVSDIETVRATLEGDNLRTVGSLLLFGRDHSLFSLVASVHSTTSRMHLYRLAIWTSGDPSDGPMWTSALGTFAPDRATCVSSPPGLADVQVPSDVHLRGRPPDGRARALPALAGRLPAHLPRPAPPARRCPAADVRPALRLCADPGSFVALRISIVRSAETLVRLRVVGCHLWEPYAQDDQGRDIYMRPSSPLRPD